jgi:hypothetical protein
MTHFVILGAVWFFVGLNQLIIASEMPWKDKNSFLYLHFYIVGFLCVVQALVAMVQLVATVQAHGWPWQ